jgi:hypothetical protein
LERAVKLAEGWKEVAQNAMKSLELANKLIETLKKDLEHERRKY